MKIISLMLLIAVPIFPQVLPNSPLAWIDHTDGVSVEAMGRGGASIAIADDAAGVWSNPAGIAAIRNTEAVLGLEGIRTRADVREDTWSPWGDAWCHLHTQDERADGSIYGLGYLAAAKPFKIGERNFVFWAGYRPMI